jgi:hypothetical protein
MAKRAHEGEEDAYIPNFCVLVVGWEEMNATGVFFTKREESADRCRLLLVVRHDAKVGYDQLNESNELPKWRHRPQRRRLREWTNLLLEEEARYSVEHRLPSPMVHLPT